MNNAGLTSGMGVTRWFSSSVTRIPLPTSSVEQRRPLVGLVDQILAAKDTEPNADITALENEIDQLVFALYDLTEKEIAAVTRSLGAA